MIPGKNNFAEFLCRHTDFYTCYSTLPEVFAVLNGFIEGNRHHTEPHRDRSAVIAMRWLVKKYGKPEGGTSNAAHICKSMLMEYGSDQKAIAAIADYADEYGWNP